MQTQTTTYYCVTDGMAIYSLGDTPEEAIADLHRHVDEDENPVPEGYYGDGEIGVIEISPSLRAIVKTYGGNVLFDIDGYGRRAVAVERQD